MWFKKIFLQVLDQMLNDTYFFLARCYEICIPPKQMYIAIVFSVPLNLCSETSKTSISTLKARFYNLEVEIAHQI